MACTTPYKGMVPVTTATTPLMRHQPQFEKELYRCMVDGRWLTKSFHLSGLVLFRSVPDGGTRVVFQNEMGMNYFDFGWDAKDNFKVHSIIPQMDRPALIKTLEADFRLLLMRGLDTSQEERLADKKGNLYYRVPLRSGAAYFNESDSQVQSIVYLGKRKPVTTLLYSQREPENFLPDTILIKHHKARFTIQLYKLGAHVTE